MEQLTFCTVDEGFYEYMLDADYGDLTPTILETDTGEIYDG